MLKYFTVLGFIGIMMTQGICQQPTLLSHHGTFSVEEVVSLTRARLMAAHPESLALPLEKELKLLEALKEFELGRFLLTKKGLNGYWTWYLIRQAFGRELQSDLEAWLLKEAPTVRATQERFSIFQREIQKRLRSGMRLASIPCGVMDDLLSLSYNGLTEITLVGVDLDPESIVYAKKYAAEKIPHLTVHFEQKDAWSLLPEAPFDLITSNGLNIYEKDDDRVEALYKVFYKALNPGGWLVTSFLSTPPSLDPKSSWRDLDPDVLKKQKAVFSDILQAGWQVFRTEEKTRNQLEAAGFKSIHFIYDSKGLFPTVIAKKD